MILERFGLRMVVFHSTLIYLAADAGGEANELGKGGPELYVAWMAHLLLTW